MRIVNATKNAVIADSFEECSSFWEQTKGMMFRKEVVPLVFTFPKMQRISLHSWFCPGAMDLIFLDDGWEVVETCSAWEPRNSYRSGKEALVLLELPEGTVWRTKTQVGDTVHIVKDFPFKQTAEPPRVQKSQEKQTVPPRVPVGKSIR